MENDWRDEMIEMLKDSVREAQAKLALAEDRAEMAEDALRNFKAEMEEHFATH